MEYLLSKEDDIIKNNSKLNYNQFVNLEKHCKPVRLIYYTLYDRATLKRRIKEILKR